MTYSPTLGRWLQQDPTGYVDGANRYQFLSSNPAMDSDPLGLCGGCERAAKAFAQRIQELDKQWGPKLKQAKDALERTRTQVNDALEQAADDARRAKEAYDAATANIEADFKFKADERFRTYEEQAPVTNFGAEVIAVIGGGGIIGAGAIGNVTAWSAYWNYSSDRASIEREWKRALDQAVAAADAAHKASAAKRDAANATWDKATKDFQKINQEWSDAVRRAQEEFAKACLDEVRQNGGG